ncbi:LLM class flavin-dependent oxidoreductase [Micromonospora sp. NPDC048999]|uniref:LLM class flavin-dependent oxidoreductase n=1 Tax=Micromonospora sp. NPDC048999 TaxID=3155391 RepID=UPI0033F99696
MSTEQQPPRLGVWTPISGNWAVKNHPEESLRGSYEDNRKTVVEAERLGFDTTLIAQHTINPGDDETDVLDTWTTSAGVAEATSDIEIIAAVKPFLYNPGVLAKMATQISHISHGRFAINLVSGWFLPEIQKLGLTLIDHDRRYDYSREWLSIVQRLWTGERVTFRGEYLKADELLLRPQPFTTPLVYFGGESEPARALAAAAADVFLINGRPLDGPDGVKAIIADLVSRPRPLPDPLRFGLTSFVIARPTEEEADEEFERLWTLTQAQRRSIAGADPARVMGRNAVGVPSIGTNGGTLAGLVGSYTQVADRISAFVDAGVETFLFQFQPHFTEMERFATHVTPRLRERHGKRSR